MNETVNNLSYQGQNTLITCAKCKEQSVLYLKAKGVLFACPKCGRLNLYSEPTQYNKIHNTVSRNYPVFNIGDKGKFEGKTYTVVGIAYKKNAINQYDTWTELVLVDETGEISFLNCAYGHFTWLKAVYDVNYNALIDPDESKSVYQDRHYKFLTGYRYKTIYCIGEFPYNPVDVSKIECRDFISPPFIISTEKTQNTSPEIYHGKHYTKKQIARIFENDKIRDIETEGIGIAQPVLGGLNVKKFAFAMLVLLAAMISITVFVESAKSDRHITEISTTIQPNINSEFVSNSFYLDSSGIDNYLEFSTSTMLSNEWVEVAMTLVNESTGEEREFGVISEYYSGVTDGYSWSEGSSNGKEHLASVPGGKYHIKGKVYSNITEDKMLYVNCRYASPSAWNLTLMIVIIFALTIGAFWLKSRYERVRIGELDGIFDSGNYE